jgi:ribosomal subunit interface protein
MIRKFEITGVHVDADEKLKKYVTKSIGKLEKYMPIHARKSAHVDVKLKESMRQSDNKCTAEIIMYLPNGTLTAKESTMNLYSAVDIVEAKLHNQLKKYKDTHPNPKLLRRLRSRFRRDNPNAEG